MIGYKLTKQDLTTYNSFQWEVGKEVTTSGNGDLCSSGWLHYYNDPLLAVLLNSIHADIENPRLFEFEAGGEVKEDYGLKFGCTRGTLVREIAVPEVTREQRIAFGILCAKQVYKGVKWNKWADNWLSGKDRSREDAAAAYASAYAAAASAAASAAAYAYASAVAAAAYAYASAVYAAYASADAAASAYASAAKLDLVSIAKEAMRY